MSFEAKLVELGIELPPAAKAIGAYKPLVLVGNLAHLSGHLPTHPDGSLIVGRVGEDVDVQAGYDAARRTALGILATLRDSLGSLDRVRRLVKTGGLVNAVPGFTEHPAVINGCSELLAEVFGPDCGVGARCAFGAGSLPKGVVVEIDAIFEVEN